MIKTIIVLFIFVITLQARENPFVALNGVSMPLTSNEEIQIDSLKQASVTLPSTARVIQSVTVKYKNLDGSIKSKKILLNNAIDWHLPIFISQSYSADKTEVKVKKSRHAKKRTFTTLLSLNFIQILQRDKELKIVTKNSVIRDFLLIKPHRIVFDIKRNIDIRSYTKRLANNTIFTNIRIGNHHGYYRVVVELDGYYTYKLSRKKNSYIFKLK